MDFRDAIIGMMLVVFNVVTFFLFAHDKASAGAGGFRVPELVLLYMVWFGSPLGGFLGIYCLNHKTRKGLIKGVFICLVLFNMLWVFLYFIITAETSLAGAFNVGDGNSTFAGILKGNNATVGAKLNSSKTTPEVSSVFDSNGTVTI